jgi:hypothetical protein
MLEQSAALMLGDGTFILIRNIICVIITNIEGVSLSCLLCCMIQVQHQLKEKKILNLKAFNLKQIS